MSALLDSFAGAFETLQARDAAGLGAVRRAALAQALAAGATLDSEPRTHVWGRIAVLADPFGSGFCLLQFLDRGYDEIAPAI